jgi:fused signal recognition particle receptor
MSSIFFWRKKREEEKLASDSNVSDQPANQDGLTPASLPIRSSKKGIRSLFAFSRFDPDDLQTLEDILLQADFGLAASEKIVAAVRTEAKLQGATTESELRKILAQVIESQISSDKRALNLSSGKLPYVFLVVGVNGAGKTTTIGKLANWLVEGSWSVVLGAADTFRAAAVNQLATWAERAGAKLVGPKADGQDPASVAFEAFETAIS